MSGLYVYALLGAPPRQAPGAGLHAEPLRIVEAGGLLAAVGDMAAAPALDEDTLRAHDAVVRRLADVVSAILPARFGALVASEAALEEALGRRARQLTDALAVVAGREQMTLRVFGEAAPAAADGPGPADGLGPGGRYLAGRAQARRRGAEVPEIAPLRPALDGLVRAERAERHAVPPLVATVHHLVDRGRGAEYLAAVACAAAGLAPARVRATRPWPPPAFPPEKPA